MADLQVIGLDVASNRQRKDATTGKQKIEPQTDKAIADKIKAIVAASKILAGRGKRVELNLMAQHQLIRKKLEQAIEQSWLLGKPRLAGQRNAKGGSQKRPRRRRV